MSVGVDYRALYCGQVDLPYDHELVLTRRCEEASVVGELQRPDRTSVSSYSYDRSRSRSRAISSLRCGAVGRRGVGAEVVAACIINRSGGRRCRRYIRLRTKRILLRVWRRLQ